MYNRPSQGIIYTHIRDIVCIIYYLLSIIIFFFSSSIIGDILMRLFIMSKGILLIREC
jgi:hypothetical protein